MLHTTKFFASLTLLLLFVAACAPVQQTPGGASAAESGAATETSDGAIKIGSLNYGKGET